MAIYPGAISSFAGFTSGHTLSADQHGSQHNSEQAEIVAVQTKVGTGASTPVAGLVLGATGTGTSSWRQVALTSDVTGTLSVANGGTGVNTSTGSGSTVLSTSPALTTPAMSNPSISGATVANLTSLLGLIYPVGCVYTETTGTNPATTFGFGTWTAFGAGRVLVGVGNNGTTNYPTAGATGGQETTNHGFFGPGLNTNSFQDTGSQYTSAAVTQLNTYLNSAGSSSISDVSTVQSVGGTVRTNGTANIEVHTPEYTAPNLQPYTVVYFWKRTA